MALKMIQIILYRPMYFTNAIFAIFELDDVTNKYILMNYLQKQCADTLTSHTMQFVLEKERKPNER